MLFPPGSAEDQRKFPEILGGRRPPDRAVPHRFPGDLPRCGQFKPLRQGDPGGIIRRGGQGIPALLQRVVGRPHAVFPHAQGGVKSAQSPGIPVRAQKAGVFRQQHVVHKGKFAPFFRGQVAFHPEIPLSVPLHGPFRLPAVYRHGEKFHAPGQVARIKGLRVFIHHGALPPELVGVNGEHHPIQPGSGAVGKNQALRYPQRLLIFQKLYFHGIAVPGRFRFLAIGGGNHNGHQRGQHQRPRQNQRQNSRKLLLHSRYFTPPISSSGQKTKRTWPTSMSFEMGPTSRSGVASCQSRES